MLKKGNAHQELTDPGFLPASGSHVFHHPLFKDKVLKHCSLSLMTSGGEGTKSLSEGLQLQGWEVRQRADVTECQVFTCIISFISQNHPRKFS